MQKLDNYKLKWSHLHFKDCIDANITNRYSNIKYEDIPSLHVFVNTPPYDTKIEIISEKRREELKNTIIARYTILHISDIYIVKFNDEWLDEFNMIENAVKYANEHFTALCERKLGNLSLTPTYDGYRLIVR